MKGILLGGMGEIKVARFELKSGRRDVAALVYKQEKVEKNFSVEFIIL